MLGELIQFEEIVAFHGQTLLQADILKCNFVLNGANIILPEYRKAKDKLRKMLRFRKLPSETSSQNVSLQESP